MPRKPELLTVRDVEDSYEAIRKGDRIVSLRLIQGGKKTSDAWNRPAMRKPVLFFGLLTLGLLLMVLIGSCAPHRAERGCCIHRHEECIDPTFPGKNCMDTTYSVCDESGTLNDAGECQ